MIVRVQDAYSTGLTTTIGVLITDKVNVVVAYYPFGVYPLIIRLYVPTSAMLLVVKVKEGVALFMLIKLGSEAPEAMLT
jgi:hypothetical protein